MGEFFFLFFVLLLKKEIIVCDQTALSRGLTARGEMLPVLDMSGVDTVLNSSSMTDTVASG